MTNPEYERISELFREARNRGLADNIVRDNTGVIIGVGRVTYHLKERHAAIFLRGILRQIAVVPPQKGA